MPSDVLPQSPSSKKKDDGSKKTKASTLTADLIAKQFYGMHQLGALFLGEEMLIDKDSAVAVGEAAYEVIKEYDLEWLGKWGKWGGLVSAIILAEVPVFMKLRAKAAAQNAVPLVKEVANLQPAPPIPGVAVGNPQ